MQATSDKTASANFTQTGHSINLRYSAGNITNGKTGYDLFYQWGRKDAFRSAEYTDAPADGTSLVYKEESVTVGTTIKNPTTHYSYSAATNIYYPYTPMYLNAWNAAYTEFAGGSTDKIDGLEKTVKSVYDPCPVGYTVSPANTFSSFNKDNMPRGEVEAYRVYTSGGKQLYFPYNGRRTHNSGMSDTSGFFGFIWVAVCANEERARQFRYRSDVDQVFPIYINTGAISGIHSAALPIRPVREN